MTADAPALSVVLRAIGGRTSVERVVGRLRRQADRQALEILLPLSKAEAADLPTAVRAEVEPVTVPDSDGQMSEASALHVRCDVGSSLGFARARAAIIASLEDTATPCDDWVAALIDAHARWPVEAVGGPVQVDADGAAAWAAFWLDFGGHVPPRSLGDAPGLSDVNISYKREALMSTRDVWGDGFNEFFVHRAFRARGYRFLMHPGAAVTLARPARSLTTVLTERFWWGRIFGAARRKVLPTSAIVPRVLAAPVLPLLLAARVAREAVVRPEHRSRLPGGIPALLACGVAWCGGELVGELTGEPF